MEHSNGLSLTMDTFLLLGNEQEYSNTLGLMIINQIRFISIYLPSVKAIVLKSHLDYLKQSIICICLAREHAKCRIEARENVHHNIKERIRRFSG